MKVKGEMCVDTAHGKMTIKVVDVTPNDAEILLKQNTINRNLREGRVKMYADDMATGNWKQNGDTVVFDNDGILRNGQHRLYALIRANVTLHNMIIVYLPKEQTSCYDLTGVRSVKDTSHFLGLDDKVYQDSLISSTIIQLLKAREKWSNSARDFSKMKIINTITENLDACCFLREHLTSKLRKGMLRKSSAIAAILCAYNNGYEYDRLVRFCEVYITGVSLSKSEIVIVKLREYVMATHSSDVSMQKDIYMRTQRALNSFETGKNLTTCRYSDTEYYSPILH